MKTKNNIEGIEGDYIETKKDSLFFDVKGLLHPTDRKICFLRFYPNPNGDRLKNEVLYKKVYNIKDRYSVLRKKYPEYLFYSKNLDLELQGVKIDEIKQIYTPRRFFGNLKSKSNLTKIESSSKKLCEFLIKEGEIPEDSIGVSGSLMIGLNKADSDIDLIIYGTKISLDFQNKLKELFEKSNDFRMYNMKEFKTHFNWRFGGSHIPLQNFIKTEKRKLHQGKFNGIDFFIRYIKSQEDWEGNFYDYRYKNYGRIKLKAKIINSDDSIFTPCSYKIMVLKLLKIDKNVNINEICEINSFRGRFCEQAKNGEIVLVEGKLEKVVFQNKEEFFRILLTDQIQDKMIVLN
jgi:predicted nucleotidyltransferase